MSLWRKLLWRRIIKIQDDIEETDKEPIEVIGKVSNEKSTKKLTKELIEESDEEPIEVIGKVSNEKSNKELAREMTKKLNEYLDECSDEYSDEELDEMFKELTESNKESSKESNKESSDEEIKKIKRPNKDESTTDWYDKNKFKKILTAIDSNNFNHKNKIGKLKFNDINNLINNIKSNTISEADTKKKINELNE